MLLFTVGTYNLQYHNIGTASVPRIMYIYIYIIYI